MTAPGPAAARRLPARPWPASARRALHPWRLWLAAAALGLAGAAQAEPARPDILAAEYAEPTRRYAHGVLGDAEEWGALRLRLGPCAACDQSAARTLLIRLPETRVFEDTAPRLADVDGDGRAEVVVVESDVAQGARLAIYGPAGLIAATPFIGRPQRWLAPVGIADLDGDGAMEIAYVDRPHLAKTLRVWRFADGTLSPVAALEGLTNHRIGWAFIPGGIRTCDGVPEIVTADAAWRRIIATRLSGSRLVARDIGPYAGPESLDAARDCVGQP